MTGVYYHKKDYAGFWKRLFSIIIDLTFIFLLIILAVLADKYLSSSIREFSYLFGAWLIFVIFYFTIIKSSNIRTLGYRIMGLKIVDFTGARPSHYKMIIRLFAQFIAPFQLPYDFSLIVDDENRQTFRDKFAGTYVIRKDAKPIYENNIVLNYYFVHGFVFIFYDVLRKDSEAE